MRMRQNKKNNPKNNSFKRSKFFRRGQCDHTQRTPSVTPLRSFTFPIFIPNILYIAWPNTSQIKL